jgi:hypothetical protein
MKTGVAVVVLLLASALPAAAAPLVSFGVEAGVVSRDVEEEGGPLVGTAEGIADSTRLTARLALQVAPMLSLFGEAGLANLSIDEFDQYRSDMHLLYGGGARFVLFEGYREPISVYSDLKVLRLGTNDRVTICTANCNDPALPPTEAVVDEEIAWTEYSVALGIKGQSGMFRPFGGLRMSTLDGTDRIGDQTIDLREQDILGFFFGTDILLDPDGRAAIMLQVSGIDENAFRVGYKVAF